MSNQKIEDVLKVVFSTITDNYLFENVDNIDESEFDNDFVKVVNILYPGFDFSSKTDFSSFGIASEVSLKLEDEDVFSGTLNLVVD